MTNVKADISNMLYQGSKLKITLPSSKVLEIRENTGEDEGTLSSIKGAMDGSSITNYIKSITDVMGDGITLEEIADMHVNDRHATLFHARLHSIGNMFTFEHTCQNEECKKTFPWEEDLSEYVNGPNEDRKPHEVEYITANMVPKYPMGLEKTHTFVLKSGRNLKFDLMTGNLLKQAADKNLTDTNINTKLLSRNLGLMHNSQFELSTHFRMYSSKDMSEIRKVVKEVDPEWNPVSKLNCPHCGFENHVEILSNPNFFFPTEI